MDKITLIRGMWEEHIDALPYVDAILTDAPYDQSMDWIPEIWTKGKGNFIVCCSPFNLPAPRPDEIQFWEKPERTMNYKKRCGNFVEMLYIYRNVDAPFNMLHWSQMTGIHKDRLETDPIHQHQKPISLMRRLLLIYTNPGDTILDPFMGSGSTAIACYETGRRFIGIEKSQGIFDAARSRMYHQYGIYTKVAR